MAEPFLTHRETVRSAEEQARYERRSRDVVEAFVSHGVDHVVGIPDNQSRAIYRFLNDHPAVRVVPICREGEAFAVASGLFAGGAEPAVVIQNTGLLEAGDSLRGTAREMGVPLVCLIGYRGYRTIGSAGADSVAAITEPTLTAWQVPYRILEPDAESVTLNWAFDLARSESRPVAVLWL